MNRKKKFFSFILLFFFLLYGFYSFSEVNAIDLKNLKAKLKEKAIEKEKETEEKKVNIINEEEYKLTVKNMEIDNQFYQLYSQTVNDKLRIYEEYLKAKDEEKRKELLEKNKYLMKLKNQIKEIKDILNNNDFLYMGIIYLPKNSNLIFFEYNGKLYFTPAFDSRVDIKDKEKEENYLPEKFKLLNDKYKVNEVNSIKDKDEFENVKETLGLIEFNSVKDSINLLTSDGDNVLLYPIEAFKGAVKEVYNKDYDTKGLFVFFLPNNYNDIALYKSKTMSNTIKLLSDYFMSVGQNHIGINSIINNIGYKEIFIPLRTIKKQEITIIKEKQPSILDLIVFILVLGGGGIFIYMGVKKLLNIYKDID